MFRLNTLIFFLLSCAFFSAEGALPNLDEKKVVGKTGEILSSHASYSQLNPELMRRTLKNFLNQIDGNKIYLLESDVAVWTSPSNQELNELLEQFEKGEFSPFFAMHAKLIDGIKRRALIDQSIDYSNLPTDVKADEFKDMAWAKTEDALATRLKRLRALQQEAASKLPDDMGEKSEQWITKYRKQYEEKVSDPDPIHRKQWVLSNILKAVASALDSHTTYFTPEEAEQFIINVQQRLFGIGAQLRDDLNGFTVTKIIEGGPAEAGGELKSNDRIVAVDQLPVVGLDIISAVEKIRGPEGTTVDLTVIRKNENGEEKRETVSIVRGEVVIKEGRFDTSTHPYGDGSIGYIKLHSFYQDPESSSTSDLANAIQQMKKNHDLKGMILDLRFNSGGILSQAVGVTGLFITKGVVVGVKDHAGKIQYLRDMSGNQFWNGPLIVLVNRSSASASEIVAQALQDYGRAIIVGDDHTFGKGSFQTFTLNSAEGLINPEGEFKVTRGRYYTVSGKTPQLTGVFSDITVPGSLAFEEVGEKFTDYPLDNESIPENFNDNLEDIPFAQRNRMRLSYKFGLQKRLNQYKALVPQLKTNSATRIKEDKFYQSFIESLQDKDNLEPFKKEQPDYQLIETFEIMKDLIYLSLLQKE